MKIRLDIKKKDLDTVINRLGDTEMFKRLRKAMLNVSFLWKGKVVGDKLSGQVLKRQTGRLAQSIYNRVKGSELRSLAAEVGSNVVYAPVHEFGAVIRPIRGKYLKFQVNGQFVSVRSVTIPARPFVFPAAKENMTTFGNILLKGLAT